MFFQCKVCAEKDKRISDLKEQIRSLSSPKVSPDHVPSITLEADGILSGQQHIIEIPTAQSRAESSLEDEAGEEISERDRILSGNY